MDFQSISYQIILLHDSQWLSIKLNANQSKIMQDKIMAILCGRLDNYSIVPKHSSDC